MLSGAVKYDIYLVSDQNGFWHSSGTWLLKRPVVLFEEKEKYVMTDLQLNHLPNLPQRETIIEVASNLRAQPSIIALWVGGSLASGVGDRFSDVDFRVAVVPDQFTDWKSPRFEQIFSQASVVGRTMLPFRDNALLHHLVLSNGEIFDFFVQSTTRLPSQEPLLILGCRSKDFEQMLTSQNTFPQMERQVISGETIQALLVNFWISSHKHRKVLDRGLDLMVTLGLNIERSMLLRLWYIEASGRDCGDMQRQTIHSLTDVVRTIEQTLGTQTQALLGQPMRDRQELYQAIESTRQNVSQIGHRLAQRYGFIYPSALEATVLQGWQAFLTGEYPSALLLDTEADTGPDAKVD